MGPGKQRKRLVKEARKLDPEEVRRTTLDHQGNPSMFVLRIHGHESLCAWPQPYDRAHALRLVTIEDDAVDLAVMEYLKSIDLVFETEGDAAAFATAKGWIRPSAQVTIDSSQV